MLFCLLCEPTTERAFSLSQQISSEIRSFGMEVHEQDRYLPIANISRIMKRSIPPTAKVSKDAKECVQECVSEFIAFITSE